MKTFLGKIQVAAAFACLTPLVLNAQNIASQPGTVNRGVERFTLLTGPDLLSPPTRPLNVSSISSETVVPGSSASSKSAQDLEAARQKVNQAKERLKVLRVERDEALERKRALDEPFKAADPLRFDPRFPDPRPAPESLRFDTKLPPTAPTERSHKL